ncbi:MAG: hypothetical protein U1E10_14870, partial [Bdellovibrionales bacterium]|nr:hypothetical protein [Bdellovibrionales bacterium]
MNSITGCPWAEFAREYLFNKVLFSFFILFAFGLPSYGSDLTLTEYLSQVKQANPTLRSSTLRAEALGHRVDPAGTWDDPFVAGGVDQVP